MEKEDLINTNKTNLEHKLTRILKHEFSRILRHRFTLIFIPLSLRGALATKQSQFNNAHCHCEPKAWQSQFNPRITRITQNFLGHRLTQIFINCLISVLRALKYRFTCSIITFVLSAFALLKTGINIITSRRRYFKLKAVPQALAILQANSDTTSQRQYYERSDTSIKFRSPITDYRLPVISPHSYVKENKETR